jgi:protein-tyrosine kinase
MLIPKASHLVERVAERLLRSGALDDSAAQLLRQPTTEPGAEPGTEPPADAPVSAIPTGLADADADSQAEASQRSSLFALPRGIVAKPLNEPAPATMAPPMLGTSPDDDEPPEPTARDGVPARQDRGQALLGAPAVLGQVRPLGGAALLDRPMDLASSDPGAAVRGVAADPAAALLQGSMSVDAVSLERAGMVDWSRTRTRISEEFRLVQRQIIRSAFGPGAEPGFSNLLLVTSARPGEGKSFMSTNLAGSIARQGDHHVLLVDADSKRDSICYSLGLAQARGLLDLAANPKLDPSPLIVRTPIERLSILPVGRERERSAELFSTKEMTRLIQSLGRRYADRLLILDAPPCLSTSDPAVLAQVVGQILFVVEADRTQRDEIEASLDLIQACPTITMVLNKQQISSRYTFGAYSSYYSS